MHTLLLRLAGPMQSWGTQSRFTIRDTTLEPSKSGVIGLLCAALGKPRDEHDETHPGNRDQPKLEVLAALRMGVRINREGVPQKDYHTAGGSRRDDYGVIQSDGKGRRTIESTRYYLANADFLVGLESDDVDLLRRLDMALANPHWQLFLGRKSFVPSPPVHIPGGLLYHTSLEAALQKDWPKDSQGKSLARLRCVVEPPVHDVSATEVRHDVPLCFAARQFTIRYVKTDWIACSRGAHDEGT